METVHVLHGRDGIDHLVLVYVLGDRQLDYEPVHIVVLIEFVNLGKQLRLGYSFGECQNCGLESHFRTGLFLIGHVGLAGSVVTDQHRYQMRGTLSAGDHLRHLGGYLFFHGRSRFLTI